MLSAGCSTDARTRIDARVYFLQTIGRWCISWYRSSLYRLTIYTENKDRLGKLLAEGRKLAVEQYSNDKELKSLGFKLLESNMTTLDGNPAYKLDYLTKPESELQRITEVVSVKDGMKYEIIFSSVVDEYNHYTPTFQKMINSINRRHRCINYKKILA